jgi:integrase
MGSSGCARNETLKLTIQDFINATNDYHQRDNIYDVLNELKNRNDIVPVFRTKRHKTNKYYYTFCSPEATSEIINYLLTIKKPIESENLLFKINRSYFNYSFKTINNTLGLGKVGTYNGFRSHMMRKFHASSLYNNGMNLGKINALQGKAKNITDEFYFMENPDDLKKVYIGAMDCLTINLDVNNYGY